MKILLSAYACEPNRGSEPGVGWEWAHRMAMLNDLAVVTRSNNRDVIERGLASMESHQRPKFIYLDLPDFFLWLKRRGLIPASLYYLLWQLHVRFCLHSELRNYDLIHHVTFNGFRFPGAWWFTSTPVILGPLGGCSMASRAFKRCFGKKWILESIRALSVRCWKWNPWTLCSLLSASKVLAVGREMAGRFEELSLEPDMMLETGIPRDLESERALSKPSDRSNFLVVGNLEPWKGWQIAMESYAQARVKGLSRHKLIFIGQGSQMRAAQVLASELGIHDHVKFLGALSRDELWKIVGSARGLIFSSIRDTSGNAALEAMALCCPVICFNHQGVGWMTDNRSALRIEPRSWEQSIEDFSKALMRLADSDELVAQLGKAARKRAMENFSWDAKIQAMTAIYESVLKAPRSSDA